MEHWLASAKRISPEHWAVVLILYRTGMEVKALSRVTWRDFVGGELMWKRPKHGETIKVKLHDAELSRAVQIYVAGSRMSSDKIDRLVRSAARATGLAELKDASPMTLRLTRGWMMLQEGRPAQVVASELALPPAIVEELGRPFPGEEGGEGPVSTPHR
jgi:integrase